MDTLTHALSGALLARATEPGDPRPDQLPRRTRMWVGFWAAAFPDSDFVARFIDPLTYLTTHRGITHSVVMLPLWAAGLALLFMLIVRGKYSWRAFVGVCALGIGVHIAGDVITAFGTMIFAPLSYWRAQIPTTFIIDPYFTAIIAGGLVASSVSSDCWLWFPTWGFRRCCTTVPCSWGRTTRPYTICRRRGSRPSRNRSRRSTGWS